MTDLTLYLAGLVVVLVGVFARPDRIHCPPRWYPEGVRPSGWTDCRPTPPHDCPSAHECDDGGKPWRLPMRVYCTGGSIPIAGDDGSTVGCQMPH